MRVFYLHGFASSAQSSKARMFSERLDPYAIHLETPDFNQPSFQTLTITRMIEQTMSALGTSPLDHPDRVAFIGSSLGAFVAVHAAAQSCAPGRVPVERLILLAPALDFASNRMRDLGFEAIERWRETGQLHVFHYGYGRTMSVGYELYEDAAKYDAFALNFSLPILIFQGTRDAVVDPDVAVRFARNRPNVTVRLLDDDHQLLQNLPIIWEESREFLKLPASA
ncbi:MAG: YqiA/YcfP family alpha/beta fold hydrolase [Acidobacteriota bacterium]